jgi:hypothetical protein
MCRGTPGTDADGVVRQPLHPVADLRKQRDWSLADFQRNFAL